jgi:hypothetical protein
MNLENFSNIDAKILMRSSKNKEINFKTITKIPNQIKTIEGNLVTFDPDYHVIPANKKAEILVTLECNNEEKIDDILELLVLNGDS